MFGYTTSMINLGQKGDQRPSILWTPHLQNGLRALVKIHEDFVIPLQSREGRNSFNFLRVAQTALFRLHLVYRPGNTFT